jgi:hypothetical protein
MMTMTHTNNDKLFGKDLRVYNTSMTETIQQLKEDIAILQQKLQKLEEAEKEPDMMLLRQGKVDIVDYDRRTFYRVEYTDSFSGIYKWYKRETTFSHLIPIQDNSEVFVLLEDFYQQQVIKQKEEYPYKKYTPEETEKSLKDAMKTAQEQGVFDKPKPETLTLKQLLKKWEFDFSGKWVKNMITSELYEEEVERFIQMFEEWMPDALAVLHDDWDDGWNNYHNTLMRKLK